MLERLLKNIVLFSGYHGWTDWYLSANLVDNENLDGQLMPGLDAIGVPMGLKGTAILDANDIQSLLNKIKGLKIKSVQLLLSQQEAGCITIT